MTDKEYLDPTTIKAGEYREATAQLNGLWFVGMLTYDPTCRNDVVLFSSDDAAFKKHGWEKHRQPLYIGHSYGWYYPKLSESIRIIPQAAKLTVKRPEPKFKVGDSVRIVSGGKMSCTPRNDESHFSAGSVSSYQDTVIGNIEKVHLDESGWIYRTTASNLWCSESALKAEEKSIKPAKFKVGDQVKTTGKGYQWCKLESISRTTDGSIPASHPFSYAIVKVELAPLLNEFVYKVKSGNTNWFTEECFELVEAKEPVDCPWDDSDDGFLQPSTTLTKPSPIPSVSGGIQYAPDYSPCHISFRVSSGDTGYVSDYAERLLTALPDFLKKPEINYHQSPQIVTKSRNKKKLTIV